MPGASPARSTAPAADGFERDRGRARGARRGRSGAAATSSRGRARRSSRPSASTSSRSCRPRRAARATASPAKGVTGRGYEGHYFWDTEIYVVPFLAHTSPEWARQVLDFRCGMLEAARRRAREVGHGGAALPVADDQRRGGLGLVRGRHGAVPHQRRHRLRDAPVQPGHGRPRVHARPGRRGARRDRPLLDASSGSSPSAGTGASASTA